MAEREPGTSPDDFDRQIAGIAALHDPLRRRLYRYVTARSEPVSREQAAADLGVALHTTRFHLDKLADAGLLDVEYRRPPGRSGPGAGRPAKLYRRSSRELAVSLPERHYELAGEILARAVTDAEHARIPVREAVRRAAHDTGRRLGARARDDYAGEPVFQAVCDELRDCGYEPAPDESGMVLANCPFHALVAEHRDLVCGMNLELIDGLLDEAGADGVDAELDPAPDRCCVRLIVNRHR